MPGIERYITKSLNFPNKQDPSHHHLLRPVRDVLVPGAGPRHVRDLESLLLARVRGLQLRVGAGGEGAGAVTAARPLLAVQLLAGHYLPLRRITEGKNVKK